MIRGTAQPFSFKLPCNFSDLLSATITFWQENYNGPDRTRSLPIIKTLSQCRQGNLSNELIVTLNTEETLRFTDKRKAYVQMMAEQIGGLPFGNVPEMITVYPAHTGTGSGGIIVPDLDNDEIIALDGLAII